MALIDKLTNIANAIRSKTGKGKPMTLEQMAEEINNLSIDDSEFIAYQNDEIVNYVVPKEATKVKSYLFQNSKSIKIADLRNATSIGDYAFDGSSLEEVIFNDDAYYGSQKICGRAFQSTKITTISSNVNMGIYSSAPNVFYNCSSLKMVYMPRLTINNSIRTFAYCTQLEKIVMKGGGFSNSNFQNCSSLTALILIDSTMTTLGNTNNFTNTPIEAGTGYIYVPKALIEEYKVATNWITYAEQFRAIEDYPEICGVTA